MCLCNKCYAEIAVWKRSGRTITVLNVLPINIVLPINNHSVKQWSKYLRSVYAVCTHLYMGYILMGKWQSKMDLDQVPSLWGNRSVQFECSIPGELFKSHLIAMANVATGKHELNILVQVQLSAVGAHLQKPQSPLLRIQAMVHNVYRIILISVQGVW